MELFENVIAMWNGGLDFIYNVSNWLNCPSPCPNTLTKQIFLYWVYRAFQVALVTKKKKKTTHTQKTCQCRRHKRCGFDPWVKKFPWKRARNPLQYSCLRNPMERGAWRPTAHRVTQSWTRLKWLSMHAHTM